MVEDERRREISGKVADPDLVRLFDYWRARHRGQLLPGRRDIDPIDLAFILGDMVLLDVLRDPLRFRYRLVGANIVMRSSRDNTGVMVHEHPDLEFRPTALRFYRSIAAGARPDAERRNMITDDQVRRYEILGLPLAADGKTVDMILVGLKYAD